MNIAKWTTWFSVLLIASTAGWMLFDGTRALIVGDYITPQTGEYAGQLGPWANLAHVIGIDPRSVWMKLIFITQGLGTLTVVVYYILNKPWARTALLVTMLLGLYLAYRGKGHAGGMGRVQAQIERRLFAYG